MRKNIIITIHAYVPASINSVAIMTCEESKSVLPLTFQTDSFHRVSSNSLLRSLNSPIFPQNFLLRPKNIIPAAFDLSEMISLVFCFQTRPRYQHMEQLKQLWISGNNQRITINHLPKTIISNPSQSQSLQTYRSCLHSYLTRAHTQHLHANEIFCQLINFTLIIPTKKIILHLSTKYCNPSRSSTYNQTDLN